MSRRRRPRAAAPTPWQTFCHWVGRLFRARSRPHRAPRRRIKPPGALRCSLHLATATHSIELFPPGPIDPLRFYQRRGVSAEHGMEFVTRLDAAAAGTEDFEPFGVVQLRDPVARLPLPPIPEVEAFWASFREVHGLRRVPVAADLITREFGAHDSRRGTPARAGANVIRARRDADGCRRVDGRVLPPSRLLELVVAALRGPQLVAWIEGAFAEAPGLGEIAHRYYLDDKGQLYLVRHHWRAGKELFLTQTHAAALRLCRESGAFRRGSARRAA